MYQIEFCLYPDFRDKYAYDECGAVISDSNQGILSISYDNLGNPRLTQFASGHQVEYVYTPSGQKVREIHRTPKVPVSGGALPGPHEMIADTTDYIGPAVYRGGKPEMVRYAGGYASLSKSGTKYVPAFHHYITDYLGNNRAVVRATDGAFVQVTHYYPWGSVYGDMGTGASVQPYKYGYKELDLTAGVARYDYAARAYFAAIPRFDRPDALAGKYPHISPYAFCANNPVNVVDPDGNLVIFINGFDFFDGGSEDYWEGKDRMIMDILEDHNVMYLDGSPSHWLYFTGGDNSFDKRTNKGEEKGFESCYDILKVTENDETIKIVTHSMGAAFAKGFLKGMEKYLKETNRVETISSIVEMEIDLAPYEPDKQQAVEGISTVTISHTGDKIAGTKPIKGAKNIVAKRGYLFPSSHLITTFTPEEIQKAVRMIK